MPGGLRLKEILKEDGRAEPTATLPSLERVANDQYKKWYERILPRMKVEWERLGIATAIHDSLQS